LRCRTFSEKLVKIYLFGPSLIHQLRLFGFQLHPQSRVLFTSFSTWERENSLAEINLESTGLMKVCNFFFGGGVNNWQTLAALWAGTLSCNKKNLDSRTQLDQPVEYASGGDPLLLYKIRNLLFFSLVRVLCALSLDSRNKLSTCS